MALAVSLLVPYQTERKLGSMVKDMTLPLPSLSTFATGVSARLFKTEGRMFPESNGL